MTKPRTLNTAFVLAAGLGTRMRSYSDKIPKPLVPLAQRALLDHVLDRLAGAGVSRAVVNVHYLADQIEAHLQTRTHPAIFISDERDVLLETGGGAVRALPLIGDAPFLIHNSDSVWIEHGQSNIRALLDAFEPDRMDCLMLLARRDATLGYDGRGDFHLAADGLLTRRAANGDAPYVFAGVSIIKPELFQGEQERPFSLNLIWNRSIAAGRLYGLVLDGLWMHVGTAEALGDAEAAVLAAANKESGA